MATQAEINAAIARATANRDYYLSLVNTTSGTTKTMHQNILNAAAAALTLAQAETPTG